MLAPKRTTLWFSLSLVALMALPPATGLSVCYSHDGHLAFIASASESADAACPCDEPRMVRAADDCLSACEDSHCESREDSHCHDFAFDPPELLRDGARDAKLEWQPHDGADACTLAALSHLDLTDGELWGRESSSPVPDPTLVTKRFTVLLI